MADPFFQVRGYGRASREKQIISPLQQESAVKDAFSLFQRMKTGWSNAQWGGFFVEEPNHSRTTKFHERPIGSQLITVSKPGDVILVSNFDRIFANVTDVCETLDLIEQRKFGIHILDMDVNLSSAMGQAVFKIMAAIKELEVKEIRRRCKETAIYRHESGLPHGKPPIGWKHKAYRDAKTGAVRRGFIPHDEERELANRLKEIKINGNLTIMEVWDMADRKRIRNPRGRVKKWSYNAIHRWTEAALRGFPLRNGEHTATPIPADSLPVDSIGADA